ncbi:MAG: hypothetical protein LLF95_07345 [Bacteroidales bacterium]|nr:hypothetical protein [Bacteroidales bacterium]
MFKICAIVSSFYPNLSELENNILTYLSWVDYLIIWENTPLEVSEMDKLEKKLNNKKVEIRTTGDNEYLAKPFNVCFQWAKEQGFTHVLTMDQDSSFENGQFSEYLKHIRSCNDNSIAVFAPNAENFDQSQELIELRGAVTSGSVYVLNAFDNSQMFNESFLIYMVDAEYCIRVRKKGYKVVCFTRIRLIHQMGYAEKSRFGLVINNYSAQSTYYIIRNIILTWKAHPDYMTRKAKYGFYKYKVIYRLGKIIFETDSILKCKAIFLALIHGHLSKGGRYDLVRRR